MAIVLNFCVHMADRVFTLCDQVNCLVQSVAVGILLYPLCDCTIFSNTTANLFTALLSNVIYIPSVSGKIIE